ncbi:hypothetical protein, partial [Avibacterium endocarditidis]|uniref:hypothetical protein n=1 Tax=Avibacterium endocarditidis TaxID=380674 RepID=UPI001CA5DD95
AIWTGKFILLPFIDISKTESVVGLKKLFKKLPHFVITYFCSWLIAFFFVVVITCFARYATYFLLVIQKECKQRKRPLPSLNFFYLHTALFCLAVLAYCLRQNALSGSKKFCEHCFSSFQ